MELLAVMIALIPLMVLPTVAMLVLLARVFDRDDAMLAEIEPRRRHPAAA